MRLPAWVICAFLLQSILAEDNDGYPKLSNEIVTQTVTKTVVTMVEATQASSKRTRREIPPRLDYKDVFVKWVKWSGSLPSFSVQAYIPGTGRTDYICASHTGCYWATGYHNPTLGPYCYYPCHGEQGRSSEFDILINEQNLELLEWKAFKGDFKNGVTSSVSRKMYVGMHTSGIGTIFDKTFYQPLLGDERYFKEDFYIMTMETGQSEQRIHDIEYNINDLDMLSQQPTIFNQMRVENHNCRDLDQEVNLEGSTERQSTWETSLSNSLTLPASIQVTVPFVSASAGVEYSDAKTITNGNSLTETVTHSLTVKATVPPNHSCVVKMAGKTQNLNIPYKAQLSREFPNGKVHTITVSGMYKGVQVGEMHAVAERCVPLPNAKPCPA